MFAEQQKDVHGLGFQLLLQLSVAQCIRGWIDLPLSEEKALAHICYMLNAFCHNIPCQSPRSEIHSAMPQHSFITSRLADEGIVHVLFVLERRIILNHTLFNANM